MSTRIDSARRLELSQVEEVGDLVTGRARGLAVTLEGETPFKACVVELGAALPIARMLMRPGDLNHPDAVETGDAAFDEPMQVTALASYAPTLQLLLSTKAVRRSLVDFFTRYPDAEFIGSRLRVPATAITQQVVVDALAIAQLVAERFAVIGFLESEEAAQLPARRHVPRRVRRMALGLGLAGTCYVGFAALFGLQNDGDGFWACIVFLLIGASVASVVNQLKGPHE